jgi:hypothetical protein
VGGAAAGPTELPLTLSEFQRAAGDLTYALTHRLSFGLSHRYDQYPVGPPVPFTRESVSAKGFYRVPVYPRVARASCRA